MSFSKPILSMTTFNSLDCKTQSGYRREGKLKEERIQCRVFAAIILVGWFLAPVGSAEAQTFKTIYTFSQVYPMFVTNYGGFRTNRDGAEPWCTLSVSGNMLYGTASTGGSSGEGTVFKLNTDGSGFSTLHNFSLAVDVQPINSDGINPMAGLALAGNTLYGTAFEGGGAANGTVFSLTTNGGNFDTLYSFSSLTGPGTNSDGVSPLGLVVSGNVIYGQAYGGGPAQVGTVFRMNTDGSGFATFDNLTNGPPSALVLSNNVLYGTTAYGGSSNNGTVFSIHVDGTGLTELYSFTGGTDGANPRAGVLLSGNVLYGTTTLGGASGQGTVFKLNTDGTGFATLHSFANGEGTPNYNYGALVLLGNNLFGLASVFPQGGTLYSLNTNGTGFTVLHTFTGPGDPTGAQPLGGLTASGSTLYGTTSRGGTFDTGTVFSFSLSPHLAIIPAGRGVILTWPTNYAGFDYGGYQLQFTTNLISPAWITNLPSPVAVNGQYAVTNPISGTQQFFRLSQ